MTNEDPQALMPSEGSNDATREAATYANLLMDAGGNTIDEIHQLVTQARIELIGFRRAYLRFWEAYRTSPTQFSVLVEELIRLRERYERLTARIDAIERQYDETTDYLTRQILSEKADVWCSERERIVDLMIGLEQELFRVLARSSQLQNQVT